MRRCAAYIHDPNMMLTFWPVSCVLWHSRTMFGTWVYHHFTMCPVHSWPLYDLDLWHQYRNYILTMNLSLARLSLLFDIGIPNFVIWVYYHETTCVHFLTFVWPSPLTYMWGTGGILSEFDSQFLSCCQGWFHIF